MAVSKAEKWSGNCRLDLDRLPPRRQIRTVIQGFAHVGDVRFSNLASHDLCPRIFGYPLPLQCKNLPL